MKVVLCNRIRTYDLVTLLFEETLRALFYYVTFILSIDDKVVLKGKKKNIDDNEKA